MPTVEDALMALRHHEDVPDADRNFLTALAEVAAAGSSLTVLQRRAARRVLDRYEQLLAPANCWPIDEVPAPAGTVSRPASGSLRAELDGDRIYLTTPFKYKDVCKALPGRQWDPERKKWHVPASPHMANQVRTSFPNISLDGALEEMCVALDEQRRRDQVDDDDLPPIPTTLSSPWKHQQRAFWFAHGREAFLLAMEMGTGKSKVTVDLLVNDAETGPGSVIYIVCPKNVLRVWPREFRKHAGERFHVVVLTDGKRSIAQRAQLADETVHDCGCGRPHVLVVNYEAAWQAPLSTWAQRHRFDWVILDESHRIKSPTGKWSKFCASLRDRARRRACLTGTAMAQGPLDIWAQYRFLEPSIFGLSYTSFRSQYAIMGGWQGKQVVGMNPLTEADLADKYYSIAFEVGEEVLDLPQHREVTRYCQLEPRAQKIYDQIEQEMYSEIDPDTTVQPPNVLVKLLRCMQLTGGALKDDEGKTVELSTAKAELLADVLADVEPTRNPTVVFCRFIHDLDVVRGVVEKMNLRYGELSGRRSDLNDDAMMPVDVDVMAVQVQSGGVGIDLTRANALLYYSVDHSLANFKQSMKRVLRPGQEDEVLVMYLVAEGTVDEDVYEGLRNNQEVIDRVRSKATVRH